MNAAPQIKAFILRAIHQAGGQPLPDSTLRAAVRMAFPHLTLTEADVKELIGDLDAAGLITGTTNTFTEQLVWVLTDKGTLQLRQLP